MTYQRQRRHCWHTTAGTIVATLAIMAGFLAPTISPAAAATTTTTTTTTITTTTTVPGSNCSASVSGTAFDRTSWVASSNAPSSSADAPADALDGDLTTRFSTNEDQAPGLYFEVDLGSAETFDALKMSAPNSPNDYARGYDVEVSTDAGSWTTVAACTGTATPQTVGFSAQTARYVKVVLNAASTTNWWSIDEFNLYGAPVITSASAWSVVPGQADSFTVTTTGAPVPALGLTGTLPPGLTFKDNDNGTATISGTPLSGARGSYAVTVTASNGVGSPAVQHLALTLGAAPVITSASAWRVVPGQANTFTVTTTGTPVPALSLTGTLPPGLAFKDNGNGTATISGTPPASARGNYEVTITATNGVGTAALQYLVMTVGGVRTTTSLSSSANQASVGQSVTYTARVVPVPNGGTVNFLANGGAIAGCSQVPVDTSNGEATCSTKYLSIGSRSVQASYSGDAAFGPSASAVHTEVVNQPGAGYWLASANGAVYGLGAAPWLGGMTTSATTGPVVGIAATPSAKGYWVVTANGSVSAFGDAKFYGDLPNLGKHVSDVVAIAPTTDGEGYYLVGADGGFFTFGNAKFHGSLPGIHLRVKDVVGVVATPGGSGYLLVGSDGGVFTFGTTHFYGSLPGIGKHVHDIRAILPSSTGRGYILVGSDGGVFNFGTGAKFHGSLPGEYVSVSDIVGIALTPDDGGYWMAGTDGHVYAFGDAQVWAEPAALPANLPVAAIAGT